MKRWYNRIINAALSLSIGVPVREIPEFVLYVENEQRARRVHHG